MIKVFVSYSHNDEDMRRRLDKHLAPLKREGVIATWVDRQIEAGRNIDASIQRALEEADLILLLVSADFLASDYCYDIEMQRALERDKDGSARVVPVILRRCVWASAPFSQLKALPEDGKPVSAFADPDEAFVQIATGIRQIANSIGAGASPASAALRRNRPPSSPPQHAAAPIRTSLRRPATDQERHSFIEEGFEHVAGVFQASLDDLSHRDARISHRFKRPGETAFTVTIYIDGSSTATCKVWYDTQGMFGDGIFFSDNAASHSGFNEQFRVDEGDDALQFKSTVMASRGAGAALTPQAVAECCWDMLVRRL